MPDFSLRSLRFITPAAHQRWEVGSALLAAVGFSVVTVADAVTEGPASPIHLTLLAGAALSSWIALALCLRGRDSIGTAIVMAAVWVELNGALAVSTDFPSAPLLATPLIVMGMGLLYGSRFSLAASIISVSVVTPLYLLSPAYATLGFPPAVVYLFSVHAVVTIASWALISVSLSALKGIFDTVQKREEELEDLIAAAPDGIILLGSDGVIRVANPAAERILGTELIAHAGRPLADVITESGVDHADGLLSSMSEPRSGTLSLVRRRRDGPPVHMEIVQRVLDGERRQLMMRDVSSRAEAEAAQREKAQRLAHGQRLEAVGQLAGGIAHDFNNLLLAIGVNTELLRDEPDAELRSELLEEIAGAQHRGATLARQLLAFARRDVAKPTVMDLGVLATQFRPLLQRVAGECVHVQCNIGAGCLVRADAGQMEQVLANLVANARDAMPAGGVCTIDVALEPSDPGSVSLRIADTGVGMSEEIVERACEPFFTTKPRGRGTGLGLSTVHGIITQCDGAIFIDSAPGAGTTIRLTLPLVAEEITGPATAPVPDTNAVVGHGTIVVAEDDESTRTTVGRILQRAGYRVVLTTDGGHALKTLSEISGEVDLLVTDMMMPVLTGRELATCVRERFPRVPILFMSGYLEHDLDGFVPFDIDLDFISKPFTSSELLRRVADKLGIAAA